MITVSLTCDCGGCESSVTDPGDCGWLELSQPYGAGMDDPKLLGPLYFSSLECLARWSQKAAAAVPDLQKSAKDGPYPRGALSNDNVPGLYV